MNSKDKNDEPEIIDLDPASVTDHDREAAAAQSAQAGLVARKLLASSPAIIALAALAIGFVAGGWAYRDYLWHYLPNAEVSAMATRAEVLANDNAALKQQVANIELLAAQLKADIDANESSASTAASTAKAASESVTNLAARIDGLSTSVQETSDKLNALAVEVQKLPSVTVGGTPAPAFPTDILQRLETLEKDVASLKAQKNDGAADTELLSQSLADLKAKIAAGTSFSEELGRLTRLVPAAPGLAELGQFGGAGIPDAKGLAKELSALAAALPEQGELQAVTPKDDSWTGWALDQLSDLITIRVAGTSDWKRAAEAAAAFAGSGDLQQAIDHLGKIEGSKPQGIEQWLEKAWARLAIETQLKSVEEAVLRAIAAKG